MFFPCLYGSVLKITRIALCLKFYPFFFVNYPLLFCYCRMFNSLCPSFLVDYPLVFCPSFLVDNCFIMTLLLFKKFTILIVTFFWVFHVLCPCRRVHNPDKAVTNRCFLYRNKRSKVRIISRNNADTAQGDSHSRR